MFIDCPTIGTWFLNNRNFNLFLTNTNVTSRSLNTSWSIFIEQLVNTFVKWYRKSGIISWYVVTYNWNIVESDVKHHNPNPLIIWVKYFNSYWRLPEVTITLFHLWAIPMPILRIELLSYKIGPAIAKL